MEGIAENLNVNKCQEKAWDESLPPEPDSIRNADQFIEFLAHAIATDRAHAQNAALRDGASDLDWAYTIGLTIAFRKVARLIEPYLAYRRSLRIANRDSENSAPFSADFRPLDLTRSETASPRRKPNFSDEERERRRQRMLDYWSKRRAAEAESIAAAGEGR